VVIEARTAAKRGHVHQFVFELRVKEFESSASLREKSRRGRLREDEQNMRRTNVMASIENFFS
jgi:hypothetical protein